MEDNRFYTWEEAKTKFNMVEGNNAFGRELLKTFLQYGQESLFPQLDKPRVDNGLEFIKEILQPN
jgi:hypothetical protein